MTTGEWDATFKILTKHGIDDQVAKDILDDIDKYRDKRSLDCKYAILTGTMETKLGDSKIIINEDWIDVETPIMKGSQLCIFHYSLNSTTGSVSFSYHIKEAPNEKTPTD